MATTDSTSLKTPKKNSFIGFRSPKPVKESTAGPDAEQPAPVDSSSSPQAVPADSSVTCDPAPDAKKTSTPPPKANKEKQTGTGKAAKPASPVKKDARANAGKQNGASQKRKRGFLKSLFSRFSSRASHDAEGRAPGGKQQEGAENVSVSSSQETATTPAPASSKGAQSDEKSAAKKVKGATDEAGERKNGESEVATTSPTKKKASLGTLQIPGATAPAIVVPPIHTPHTPSTPHADPSNADVDVIVPPTPSKASHVLPQDETLGLTAGAVQPPGSTGDEPHDPHTRNGSDVTDDPYTTDDDYHDVPEQEDIDAMEARLIASGGSGIPMDSEGVLRPLLPPLLEEHKGRKCLILDMDETLLHSSFKLMPTHDFTVAVEIEWQWHNAYVLKRPGVEEFLRKMGEIYEVVIFTASVSKYADPVLDTVDVHTAVTHRLFRESCYSHRGNYVKDLSMLGRPIEECIILDNSPASYLFNQNNAVPVMTWFNDPHDTELTDLIGLLEDLARPEVKDVRGILARFVPDE